MEEVWIMSFLKTPQLLLNRELEGHQKYLVKYFEENFRGMQRYEPTILLTRLQHTRYLLV
jgi:hypothetical protein